jgi:hypothetical protein
LSHTQLDFPVFRSVGQALAVAYAVIVTPPGTRSPTQSVIDDLMELAGIPKERRKGGESGVNFGRLTPLEIRAQCAMIIASVRDYLPEGERFAIEAWFARDDRKAEGVRYLREWCEPHWTLESPQVRMLIMWHIHLTESQASRTNCTERAIAGEHAIPKSTIHDQVIRVRKHVSALRRNATDRLEEHFERQGLVGEFDDQA